MKHYNLQVAVDTEERLILSAYRIDLMWKDPSKRTPGEPDAWSEYFHCRLSEDEFRKQAKANFGDDFVILKIESIRINPW